MVDALPEEGQRPSAALAEAQRSAIAQESGRAPEPAAAREPRSTKSGRSSGSVCSEVTVAHPRPTAEVTKTRRYGPLPFPVS